MPTVSSGPLCWADNVQFTVNQRHVLFLGEEEALLTGVEAIGNSLLLESIW